MLTSPFSFPHSAWVCTSLPFHGYPFCMPLPHTATYLGYVGTSIIDLIQTCTHTIGSKKRPKAPVRELQFSSLGLSPLPLVRTPPKLIASTLS